MAVWNKNWGMSVSKKNPDNQWNPLKGGDEKFSDMFRKEKYQV